MSTSRNELVATSSSKEGVSKNAKKGVSSASSVSSELSSAGSSRPSPESLTGPTTTSTSDTRSNPPSMDGDRRSVSGAGEGEGDEAIHSDVSISPKTRPTPVPPRKRKATIMNRQATRTDGDDDVKGKDAEQEEEQHRSESDGEKVTTSPPANDAAAQICLCPPEPKIPRPRNAFMLYRQHLQSAVAAQNPGLANPDISKIIGKRWREEEQEIKDYWDSLAEEEKARHHEQYPNYKYQPRRKGKRPPALPQVGGAGTASSALFSPEGWCGKCGRRTLTTPRTPITPSTASTASTASKRLAQTVSAKGNLMDSRYCPQANGPANGHPAYYYTARKNGQPSHTHYTSHPQGRHTRSSISNVTGSNAGYNGNGNGTARELDGDNEAQMVSPLTSANKRQRLASGLPSPPPSSQFSRPGSEPQPPGNLPSPLTYLLQRRDALQMPYGARGSSSTEIFGKSIEAKGMGPPPRPVHARQDSLVALNQSPQRDMSSLTLPPIKTTQAGQANGVPLGPNSAVISNLTNRSRGVPSPMQPANESANPATLEQGRHSSSSSNLNDHLRLLHKVNILSRISPPLSIKGEDDSSRQRGPIISIDGENRKMVMQVLKYLVGHLAHIEESANVKVYKGHLNTSSQSDEARDGSVSPKLEVSMLSPKDDASEDTPNGTTSFTFQDYLSDISSWHKRSSEVSGFVNNASDASIPVAIVAEFMLTGTNKAAASIPIRDAYSPTDHWQWAATLWRGIVGPDLTIWIEDVPSTIDSKHPTASSGLDIRDEAKLFIIRKDADQKEVESKVLRRLAFEVSEWVRGF